MHAREGRWLQSSGRLATIDGSPPATGSPQLSEPLEERPLTRGGHGTTETRNRTELISVPSVALWLSTVRPGR